MSTGISRSWLLGGWCATVAVLVAATVALGADTSTSVILLVLGVTPAVIMMLIGGTTAPTVAEILHSVETKTRP
jgi:hypothetical protein